VRRAPSGWLGRLGVWGASARVGVARCSPAKGGQTRRLLRALRRECGRALRAEHCLSVLRAVCRGWGEISLFVGAGYLKVINGGRRTACVDSLRVAPRSCQQHGRTLEKLTRLKTSERGGCSCFGVEL